MSATSFQELICLNIKPVIRESQSYLKWSGKDKESWACVVNVVVLYCSTVLGRKRSFLAKGLDKKCNDINKDKYDPHDLIRHCFYMCILYCCESRKLD